MRLIHCSLCSPRSVGGLQKRIMAFAPYTYLLMAYTVVSCQIRSRQPCSLRAYAHILIAIGACRYSTQELGLYGVVLSSHYHIIGSALPLGHRQVVLALKRAFQWSLGGLRAIRTSAGTHAKA